MTTTRRQRASAHANHPHYCSCLRVVFGNGGKAQHQWMHERRADGHHYVIPGEFRRLQAAALEQGEA